MIVSAVLAVSVAVSLWAAHRGLRDTLTILSGIQDAIRDVQSGRIDAVEERLGELLPALVELDAKVDQLPSTWEEMHHKVRRTEERTRGAVRRAMAELEENGVESPELTEIGHQLRIPNGTGSTDGGLSPMPAGMGSVPQTPPTPADGRAAAIAYKYNRR